MRATCILINCPIPASLDELLCNLRNFPYHLDQASEFNKNHKEELHMARLKLLYVAAARK